MEKEEIEFFREKLISLYKEVTDQILEDKKAAESQIDQTKIANVKTTSKGVQILKSILKLGLRIIFMNKVSDNVTESDFKHEVNGVVDAFKGKSSGTAADNIRNDNYIFQSECFDFILKVFTKMRLLVKNDDDVEKFAQGMYEALDICEWNKESDYITTVMFLFKSDLMKRNEFARLCVVDDIHKEYNGILKKYTLNVRVLGTLKAIFAEYEQKFNKKFSASKKHK